MNKSAIGRAMAIGLSAGAITYGVCTSGRRSRAKLRRAATQTAKSMGAALRALSFN